MATLRSNELKNVSLLILADDVFTMSIYEGNTKIGEERALVRVVDNVLEVRYPVEFAVPQGTTITNIVLRGVIHSTTIEDEDDLFFVDNGIYVVSEFEFYL